VGSLQCCGSEAGGPVIKWPPGSGLVSRLKGISEKVPFYILNCTIFVKTSSTTYFLMAAKKSAGYGSGRIRNLLASWIRILNALFFTDPRHKSIVEEK
jgi:hypothetical protein